jgi:CHAD domain-containing protein
VSAKTTGRFAAEEGDRLLRDVTIRIARTIKSHGVAEVHDLRVAIRRFTRILVVLKACFPRGESRRMRRGLKRIMIQAGSVRDHDVAIRLLTKVAASEAGSVALVQNLRERREDAALTLTASLRRWGQRSLAASWRKALDSEVVRKGADARFCSSPIDATVKHILPAMAKDHFRCGKQAAYKDASAKEIHRFRIAAKNLRYTLDLFAPVFATINRGTPLLGLIEQLKEIQALLGDINDCATVRRMLSRKKDLPQKAVGDQKNRKELLSALKKRQHKKTEEFRQRYDAEFASAASLTQWKASLQRVRTPARATKKTPKAPIRRPPGA